MSCQLGVSRPSGVVGAHGSVERGDEERFAQHERARLDRAGADLLVKETLPAAGVEGVQFTGDEAREQMEAGLDMGAADVLVGRDKFDTPAARPTAAPTRPGAPPARPAPPIRPAASSSRRSG